MKHIQIFVLCLMAALAGAQTALSVATAATVQSLGAAPAASRVDVYQRMALAAGENLVGTRVAPLVFLTIDGRKISLGGARHDRPIYLKFWATWCTTCLAQMPGFKADFKRLGNDIDMVAVNTGIDDDIKSVEAYRARAQLPMPIAIDDGRLAQAFHLRVTPQHVIIGRDGVIRYIGHLDGKELEAQLQAAIDDLPVPHSDAPSAMSGPPVSAFTTVQGASVNLGAQTSGAPRLLYFMSPWCETYLSESRPTTAKECRATREALTRVVETGAAQVIDIASALSTDEDGVRRYLNRTGSKTPIILDGDGALFRRFGVRKFPAVVKLDQSGRPVGRVALPELRTFIAKWSN